MRRTPEQIQKEHDSLTDELQKCALKISKLLKQKAKKLKEKYPKDQHYTSASSIEYDMVYAIFRNRYGYKY